VTRYAGACPHAEVDIVPELPEVETVCRGLAATLEGRRLHRVIQRRPDLRFPLPVRFADRLQGRRIDRVYRRAKFILIRLDDDSVILAHLGMSGRMVVGAAPVAEFDPHDHVIFETDNGTAIRFNDARRFGFMHLVAASELDRHPLLSALGPEPLGNNFNGPVLAAALRGKKTPIKAAIVDQRVVAGIGNIYASESLFHAGISPRRMARTVQGERAERLAAAIKRVLEDAIAAGGSSLRDFVQTNGELGYFQHRWAVYEREGQSCPGCRCDASTAGGIRRIVQSGRSTFYCPNRQR
jgi:formamidopyrimidine-DNA glycosylase